MESENPFELLERKNYGHQNTLLFDTLLIEAERLQNLRVPECDLYFKDPISGEFRKIAEAYHKNVSSFKESLFKRKRNRFFITFNDTLEQEEKLKPRTLRFIRSVARTMSYNNTLKDYSIRDLMQHFKVHKRYIDDVLVELFKTDLVRFKVVKNRRTYMINPTFYYRGTPTSLFNAVRKYNEYPPNAEYLALHAERKDAREVRRLEKKRLREIEEAKNA